jgi:hypothetical protein
MGQWKRWQFVATGILLLVSWLACWAATVGPTWKAIYIQWFLGNALAFLAGIAFGMSLKTR